MPFDIKLALKQEEEEKAMISVLSSSPAIDPLTRNMLNNVPEDLKLRFLESVLKSISESPELTRKVREEFNRKQS